MAKITPGNIVGFHYNGFWQNQIMFNHQKPQSQSVSGDSKDKKNSKFAIFLQTAEVGLTDTRTITYR